MPDFLRVLPVFYDSTFLRHATGGHPECPERLQAILERLTGDALKSVVQLRTCQAPDEVWITAVHGEDYVRAVRQRCENGGGWLDADTILSPGSFDAARLACGAVCHAVREVVEGRERAAFCAVRPPGHHAESNRGMGFCLLNNVAVAAEYSIRNLLLNRILVIDWDVHHGNGTQEIFWTRAEVGYLSIHRYPFYPGTGTAGETGSADGLGCTLNLPISFGTPPSEFLKQFRRGLEQIAQRIQPELILISAGFDAFVDDPIGSLGLGPEDFGHLTDAVVEMSREYCPGKIVSVLEGGYHLDGLASCTENHLLSLSRSLN